MPRGKKKVEDVVKAVEEKAVATEVEVKKATRAAGRKAKAKVEEAAEKVAEKVDDAATAAKIEAGKDWKGALAKQESVTQCGACHSKGKMSDIVKGNMDCTPCHSGSDHVQNKFVNHP